MEHSDRERRDLRRVALIQMKAAGQREYLAARERSDDQQALMPDDGAVREAGDVAIQDSSRILETAHQAAQSRTEDDAQRRCDAAQTLTHGVGRSLGIGGAER